MRLLLWILVLKGCDRRLAIPIALHTINIVIQPVPLVLLQHMGVPGSSTLYAAALLESRLRVEPFVSIRSRFDVE